VVNGEKKCMERWWGRSGFIGGYIWDRKDIENVEQPRVVGESSAGVKLLLPI